MATMMRGLGRLNQSIGQSSSGLLINELPKVVGSVTSKCGVHDVIHGQHDNLSAYKRGKGGRGSFNGMVTTVFGASGFMGRYVVHRLAKMGSQVICPYRGDPYFMRDLKLAGELGQILFLPFNLRDEESVRKCMKYSNVVINLIGRDWDTKNFTYDDVHVTGARTLARIAHETGIERFIHMSHLNADPNPTPLILKHGSKFLKSKHYGELAVKEEFPDATVFRPADIWGPEDRFLNYYANGWRRNILGWVPLWKRGKKTIKQPVFCFNVAEGIINSLQEPSSVGTVYECVGPKAYYLSDLVDYFYRCMRFTAFIRLPLTPTFWLKAKMLSYSPSYPVLALEKLELEHTSDVLRDYLTLEDLGVKLTPLEDRAPWELKPFRQHNYYEEKVGEFPEPAPPPFITT